MSSTSPAPSGRSVIVAAMNNPALDWTRTPVMRRRLVLGSVSLTLALHAALTTAGLLSEAQRGRAALLTLGASALLMIAWMILTGWLNASVRGTADPLVAHLAGGHDEWQRRLHDQTYRRCYWPAFVLMSVLMLAVIIADLAVIPALALFFGGYFTALMAPLWTLAWTLPQDLREG